MKREKVLWFALCASILFNLIFVVFAAVQKAAADTAREQAIENERRAVEQRAMSEHQAILAEQARAEALLALQQCEAQRTKK